MEKSEKQIREEERQSCIRLLRAWQAHYEQLHVSETDEKRRELHLDSAVGYLHAAKALERSEMPPGRG